MVSVRGKVSSAEAVGVQSRSRVSDNSGALKKRAYIHRRAVAMCDPDGLAMPAMPVGHMHTNGQRVDAYVEAYPHYMFPQPDGRAWPTTWAQQATGIEPLHRQCRISSFPHASPYSMVAMM